MVASSNSGCPISALAAFSKDTAAGVSKTQVRLVFRSMSMTTRINSMIAMNAT